MPLAHHTAPLPPQERTNECQPQGDSSTGKTVTTAEEDVQQAHVCDVKPGECGPWWPQKIQSLVQTHSVGDNKAKECIPDWLAKTGCGQRAPDYDTKPGAAPLITTSNPGTTGHRLKKADWTPAGDLCQGHTPFLSVMGCALISLLGSMSGMAPVSRPGTHPTAKRGPRLRAP